MKTWALLQYTKLLIFIYEYRVARARRTHKCVWRCLRDGGGGQLVTPRPMTQEAALKWLGRTIGAEPYHVDFDHRFIFYRSHGQGAGS